MAKATGTHAPSLYRVMRALSSLGIFEETGKGFGLTPLSVLLQKDTVDSIHPVAIMRGEECNWKPWGDLLYGVRTGESPFQMIFKQNLFQYYAEHPEAASFFDRGMSVLSKLDGKAVLNSYDFSAFKKAVDIGGGDGTLLLSILQEYPGLQGILYDLPHVIRNVKPVIESGGMKNRVEMVEGDFFTSVPLGGDIYILKRIVHDWNDDRASAILKNCRLVMREDSKLLLIEMVINPESVVGKVNDIHMMVVTPGGRERTESEFEELLIKSGFKMMKVIPTGGANGIIEAKPV